MCERNRRELTCFRAVEDPPLIVIMSDHAFRTQVPESPHCYSLEFVFDAAADCTLSIWYLTEEITDQSNNTLRFETNYQVLFSKVALRLSFCTAPIMDEFKNHVLL